MARQLLCIALLCALAGHTAAARAASARAGQAAEAVATAGGVATAAAAAAPADSAPDASAAPGVSAAASSSAAASDTLITIQTNMSTPEAKLLLEVPSLALNTQAVVARANATHKQQSWSVQADGTLRAVAANGSVTGRCLQAVRDSKAALGSCASTKDLTSMQWFSDSDGRLHTFSQPMSCLFLNGTKGSNANKVYVAPCSPDPRFRWELSGRLPHFLNAAPGSQVLQPAFNASLCVGAKPAGGNGTTKATAPLSDRDAAALVEGCGSDAAQWTIDEGGVIKNVGDTKKCLTVSGAKVYVVNCAPATQPALVIKSRWFTDTLGRLHVYGAPSLYLSASNTKAGAALSVLGCRDSDRQKWGMEMSSYKFYPDKDSPEGDGDNLSGLSIANLVAACDDDDTCKGFTSAGRLKTKLKGIEDWVEASKGGGLYVKKSKSKEKVEAESVDDGVIVSVDEPVRSIEMCGGGVACDQPSGCDKVVRTSFSWDDFSVFPVTRSTLCCDNTSTTGLAYREGPILKVFKATNPTSKDVCAVMALTELALNSRWADMKMVRPNERQETDAGHAAAFIQLYAFQLVLWDLLGLLNAKHNPCSEYDPAVVIGRLA